MDGNKNTRFVLTEWVLKCPVSWDPLRMIAKAGKTDFQNFAPYKPFHLLILKCYHWMYLEQKCLWLFRIPHFWFPQASHAKAAQFAENWSKGLEGTSRNCRQTQHNFKMENLCQCTRILKIHFHKLICIRILIRLLLLPKPSSIIHKCYDSLSQWNVVVMRKNDSKYVSTYPNLLD